MVDRYRYGLRRTVPASLDVVTIAQARANCSIDNDDHDSTLSELIAQAREYCEAHTDGCLTSTTWAWTFDRFPVGCEPLVIPRWPVQSISSIAYTDSAGEAQTIDAADIALRIDDHGRGRLALKNWESWPAVKHTPDAVTVTFVAGWVSAAEVPPPWIRAQLMLIAWWFEQREAGIIGTISSVAPIGVQDLLAAAACVDDFEHFDLG